MDQTKSCVILIVLFVLGIAACRKAPDPIDLQLPVVSTVSPASQMPGQTPTFTPLPSPTRTPEKTTTDAPVTPTGFLLQDFPVCSPLPGYSQADLIAAISNPYMPPARQGSDDPHQAVDLAVEQFGMALSGETVQAVLSGRVAAVIEDRFPYGNALLVETAFDGLPPDWLAGLQAPTPAPTLGPHPSLTCPQLEQPFAWDNERRSLYLLYAHLLEPVELSLGDSVSCGESLGQIGQSGNALNPHLHIETRVGPSGARFISMAHYSGGISPEEMSNYCTWRVSGLFQLADPMRVLEKLP